MTRAVLVLGLVLAGVASAPGADAEAQVAQWTQSGRGITITCTSSPHTEVLSGTHTTRGISKRAQPGVIRLDGNVVGSFYAIKTG